MPAYAALGLAIDSDSPLPGLAPADRDEVDLLIRCAPGSYEARRVALEHKLTDTRAHEDTLVLRRDAAQRVHELVWWDHNRFLVELEEGQVTLFGARPDDTSHEWFATYLTGPLLGFSARLLGHLVLHGTVVNHEGRGIALVGHGRAGKSTLGVALAAIGARVVADDLCSLALAGPRVVARPGPRRVRLWEDGAVAVGAPEAPRIAPDWAKRFVDERHVPFSLAPQPLDLILVLDDEGPARRLSPSLASLALLERVSGGYLSTRAMIARELSSVADLVERVPVFTLPRAPDASRVHERAQQALQILAELA